MGPGFPHGAVRSRRPGVRQEPAPTLPVGPLHASQRTGDTLLLRLKGNLAHNFMDLYHLDISNMLKTKNIGNTGKSAGHRGEKIKIGNSFKFGFPKDSPCDVITLGNSLLTKTEFIS